MPSPAAGDQEPLVIDDEEPSAEDDDATRPAVQEPPAADLSMLGGGDPLNPTLLLQAMLGMANFMGPPPTIMSPPVMPPLMGCPFGNHFRPGAHFRPIFPAPPPQWHPQLGYPGPAPPQMQRPEPIRPSTSGGAFAAPREVGAMKRLAETADWVHLNPSKNDGCIEGWPSVKKLRVVQKELKIKQMDEECNEIVQRVVKRLVTKLLTDAKVDAARTGNSRIRRANILNVLHSKS